MVKKKLHTLQYLQNKDEIERIKRVLGLTEPSSPTNDEIIERIREKMEKLSNEHKKKMRSLKIKLFVLGFIALGIVTSIVYSIIKIIGN